MSTFRVTYTVAYESSYAPEDEEAQEAAMMAFLDESPGALLAAEHDVAEAVARGWRVEHPDWGDVATGTLK